MTTGPTPVLLFYPFIIFADHKKTLETLGTVGEHHSHVQIWLEVLNAYQYKLVYRNGSGYCNSSNHFTSRLPFPATESNIHGDSQHTQPGDVDVHFVEATGSCPGLPLPNVVPSLKPAVAPLPLLDPPVRLVQGSLRSKLTALPPVSLTERDFHYFRSRGPFMSTGTDMTSVTPVCPFSLSERTVDRSEHAQGLPTTIDRRSLRPRARLLLVQANRFRPGRLTATRSWPLRCPVLN